MVTTLLGASCGPQGVSPPRQEGQGGGDQSAESLGRPGQASQPAAATEAPRVQKRLVAGLRGDPAVLSSQLSRSGAGRVYGVAEIEMMLNPGIVLLDNQQNLRPILVESVPTVDNGGWKVFPDGRMVTTWKLKPNVLWHDGTPLTSADLVFTMSVVTDPDLAEWNNVAFGNVEGVSAPDPLTVVVNWQRPFISANEMFTGTRALPQPKHLLESTYADNKAAYNSHPYWNEEYVGTGGYRLREFSRGSYLRLEANDRYVLGRPQIDEIEVKLVQDANALAANILAGLVDLTLSGSSLTIEQAIQVRDQRWDGRLVPELSGTVGAFPQFINPNPAVILDVAFRRALLQAIDRQLLVDTLQFGLSQISHTNMVPDNPEYRYVEPRLVKYPYDPRAAAQLIEGLGFTKGQDGSYRDPNGQRLAVELRSTPGREVNEKTTLSVANMWQQLGVGVDTVVLSPQQNRDREFRQTRPAFEVVGQPQDIYRLHSRELPTAETRFVGDNRPRYANPQLDELIDRYYLTIPVAERAEIVGQMYHLITDQVVSLNFFYEATQRLEANRLRNVSSPLGWNVQEWDLAL
jgi:peptide/nickel transport system substrate-binding protein